MSDPKLSRFFTGQALTVQQMVAALVGAIEAPPGVGVRTVDVAGIRGAARK